VYTILEALKSNNVISLQTSSIGNTTAPTSASATDSSKDRQQQAALEKAEELFSAEGGEIP
jgi:hypothetical protein